MMWRQKWVTMEREQLMYDQMEDYTDCSLMEGS